MTYPRDMAGYGRTPPQPNWPNKARIAVQFVINYEEGGENNILHGDAASEAFLSEIVGAAAWPGMRHMNMESIYEYGSRAGYWRLWRLFTQRKIPVTVYAVASALQRNPEIITSMHEAGWEIATHGLKWIDYRDHTKAAEKADIDEAIRLHAALCGARPLGMYQGRSSLNTLDLTAEEGGFLYGSDAYADDLPYWMPNAAKPLLIIPYTLDANDMRFATPQGFNTGEHFYTYLKDSFDMLYAEGQTAPKMMSVGLHCRLVGRPGRALALARFLDYVQSKSDVWVATRLDIARHWVKNHPPDGGFVPSKLGPAVFREVYGDIFEHSAYLADAVHSAGLTTDEDTARGLHSAFLKALHATSREQKLLLIKAHPDLAGKLALAQKITLDSAKEQGSAGLDRLSSTELDEFNRLNSAYRYKFDFPFIFAVKGKSKEDILAAFTQRIDNDQDAEFAEAIRQIERIALLRLQDRLP